MVPQPEHMENIFGQCGKLIDSSINVQITFGIEHEYTEIVEITLTIVMFLDRSIPRLEGHLSGSKC